MTESGIKRGRGRPRIPRTPADEFRERVKAAIGWCACCDRPLGSVTKAAAAIGMPQPSLYKWLAGERPLPAPHVGGIERWLTEGGHIE